MIRALRNAWHEGLLHTALARIVSRKLPGFLRAVMSGADAMPSGQRAFGGYAVVVATYVTYHGLQTGKLAHDIALGFWLSTGAAGFTLGAITAIQYFKNQSPAPDPHNPPTPQP